MRIIIEEVKPPPKNTCQPWKNISKELERFGSLKKHV